MCIRDRILSGQVQVTNGSLSVSLLRAGELFGAAALYNDAPEFAAVLTAQSPCRVLFLPQETLDRLLGEEPLLRRNYLQYLTGRIRFLSGRLRSVAQTLSLIHISFPVEGSAVYYVGPTPERPGQIIGSAGPTTSGRMDAYSPRLLDLGQAIMIGKGARNQMCIRDRHSGRSGW